FSLWFFDGVRRGSLRLATGPLLGWLAAYVGVLYLAALSAPDLGEALAEVVKWVEVAAVLLVVSVMLPPDRHEWLVAALLLGAIGQALLGLYQFLFRVGPEWFVIFDRFMRASGTFGQPNPYAAYLGLSWPVAISLALWGWRTVWRSQFRQLTVLLWTVFYTVAALLIGLGLAASWSRGAWFGAAVGVGIVLVMRSRQAALAGLLALLLLLTAILLGTVTPKLVPAAVSARLQDLPGWLGFSDVLNQPVTDENFAVVERVAHWVAALRMWELSPWLGVGPGNFTALYPLVRLPRWEDALGHAHNIYLNVLAETGLVGLIAFLAWWSALFVWVLRRWREWQRRGATRLAALAIGVVGVLAYLSVHSFFDNLFVQGMQLHVALWLTTLQVNPGGDQKGSPTRTDRPAM
ncbi:MAG TPA: O-antigen ligase family protein, partial [Caldilineaceae bacterium]|nr:O-antigen ligase family protein [Caldilineaceae bacterium]